jgi:hypothetical protein
VDLPDGNEIYDNSAKTTVPYEILFVGQGIRLPGFGGGYKRVRFEAKDLPSFGYKLYSLRPQQQSPAAVEEPSSGNIVENRFYRITIDPASGAIAGIFDKELGRELVDRESPYKFGAYVYVSGGDDYPRNSLYRFGAGLNPPRLVAHPAAQGKLIGIRKTPFGAVIALEASGVNTPRILTEIALFENTKKIEFRYSLHKERVLTRESAYIAFPVQVPDPSFSYGNQIGWVDPAHDELPGGSREWYVARHWACVQNHDTVVTIVPLDAPLVNFGDIVRGEWPKEFQPRSSILLSWLMNNYWGTNFPAWQGGDYTFRYVMTSASKADPPALERIGLEAMTPVETTLIPQTKGKRLLPADQASLLSIDNPNVQLSAWKMAEAGDGSIIRLQETAGTAAATRIRSEFFGFARAWQASPLEDNLSEIRTENGAITVTLQPFQTITLRVETAAAAP